VRSFVYHSHLIASLPIPPILCFSLGSLGFLVPYEYAHYQKHIKALMSPKGIQEIILRNRIVYVFLILLLRFCDALLLLLLLLFIYSFLSFVSAFADC
jgi:hypothetical protein